MLPLPTQLISFTSMLCCVVLCLYHEGEQMAKGKDINSLFQSLLFTDNTFGSLPELSGQGQGHKSSSQEEWGYEADNMLLGE